MTLNELYDAINQMIGSGKISLQTNVQFQGCKPSAHLTRIKQVTERGRDCCGGYTERKYHILEIWYGSDDHHRLTVEKLLKIIQPNLSQYDVFVYFPSHSNEITLKSLLDCYSHPEGFLYLTMLPVVSSCPDPSFCCKEN